MGRVIVSEFISLDGYYADAVGGLDWVTADDEHHGYSIALLERTAILLFGRTTWEMFVQYWPRVADDPAAPAAEIAVGGLLNSIPKVVFSSALTTDTWLTNVRRGVLAEEVIGLREDADGDVVVLGSGTIVKALESLQLVDEYQLQVQPVALGGGAALFEFGRRTDLERHRVELLSSGVVRDFLRPLRGRVQRTNYES